MTKPGNLIVCKWRKKAPDSKPVSVCKLGGERVYFLSRCHADGFRQVSSLVAFDRFVSGAIRPEGAGVGVGGCHVAVDNNDLPCKDATRPQQADRSLEKAAIRQSR